MNVVHISQIVYIYYVGIMKKKEVDELFVLYNEHLANSLIGNIRIRIQSLRASPCAIHHCRSSNRSGGDDYLMRFAERRRIERTALVMITAAITNKF